MRECTTISLVLPTRNRPDVLDRTLRAIGQLSLTPLNRAEDSNSGAGCEVIVIDNASDALPDLPSALPNGVPVTFIPLPTNLGAAARNHGAQAARGDWLLMLDDDSHPIDAAFARCAARAPNTVAAIGAEITLPTGRYEDGGLPEVIIGCGALVRRDAFLAVGGYDPSYQYYAEEYDLCAKLIGAGWHITHDRAFRVLHEKVSAGRDMNLILHRLVRNNGWTLMRYAPPSIRDRAIRGTIDRYRVIAQRENAMQGFMAGLSELERTIGDQTATPLAHEAYDRFTGLAAARETLHGHMAFSAAVRVALIEKGKHAWAVRQALASIPEVNLVHDEHRADVHVISTLSPGPMLNAVHRRAASTRPVLMPWRFGSWLNVAAHEARHQLCVS